MNYLSGSLFMLAGAIELATWMVSHNTLWISIGAMFISLGGIFFGLGAAARKKESEAGDVAAKKPHGKGVWIGLLEVTQIPGDQRVTLNMGAAFTWFTCWAEDQERYIERAREVLLYYGLHLIGWEKVFVVREFETDDPELIEQINRTFESKEHSLYGTFHTYPPRYQ